MGRVLSIIRLEVVQVEGEGCSGVLCSFCLLRKHCVGGSRCGDGKAKGWGYGKDKSSSPRRHLRLYVEHFLEGRMDGGQEGWERVGGEGSEPMRIFRSFRTAMPLL